MRRYKLKETPKCIRCGESTIHYRISEHLFLNTLFVAEWFKCKKCGKIQAKVVEILRRTHEPKI